MFKRFLKFPRPFLNMISPEQSVNTYRKTSKQVPYSYYGLVICPMTAFGLCYWQYKRRIWKLNLIEQLEHRIPMKPVQLDKKIKSSEEILEFTPVSVTGWFDHTREMAIGPRALITDFIKPEGYASNWIIDPNPNSYKKRGLNYPTPKISSGFCIITPFRIDGTDDFILVNRGWIASEFRDPTKRMNGQIMEKVTVTGYIRHNEPAPWMSPSPPVLHVDHPLQAPHIQFFSRQIDKMSKLTNSLPILIDADYASSIIGGPVGGQTRVNLRNEHLTYMITWASLGTITFLYWLKLIL